MGKVRQDFATVLGRVAIVLWRGSIERSAGGESGTREESEQQKGEEASGHQLSFR